MRTFKLTALLATLAVGVALAAPPVDDKAINARVDKLLKQMTLDEKIGQLSQIGGIALIPDSMKVEDRVRQGQAGSILWVNDPKSINRLQKIAVEESRLHIPMIFGLDVIHGFHTIFPMPLALASSWDPGLVERVQSAAAREARAAGLHWTFAPMVDIARDVRWGRMVEGAGEDPYLGAAIAQAQVRGFQGDDVSRQDKVLACAKHFAGYGAAVGGRDYDSSFIPDSDLYNVYLPPFKAAKDAGVATFMSAYMDLNDVPATGNAFLLRDVLRKQWGFSGFVVSDANSVADLFTHGFARDAQDAAYRGFSAGVDMDMASKTYLTHLATLVKSGKVSETMIDASVRPILAAKFRLGLFENPYADPARYDAVVADASTKTLAREAAQRSIILLRNEKLLPLKKDAVKKIAVVGPLGDATRDMLSMWAGFTIDLKKIVSVTAGLRNKLGATATVDFAQGVQIKKRFPSMFEAFMGGPKEPEWSAAQAKTEFDKAVALAASSDVVVMTLGEKALMSGELASQSSLELPGQQQQLLEAVVATGKPVVLVLISGRPLNIEWANAHVGAILEAWHPGDEGGNAVADILFGDAAPSAKLTISWPLSAGQLPYTYAHTKTHQPESAPGFTSRYWDIPSKPLFPFGYGLTYTTFAYSDITVSQASAELGTTLEVTAKVTNTGARAGEEIAQLYIHQKAGSASRPVRQLKGFTRVALQPGESKTVRFTLGANELTYWSASERKWVLEAEAFDVWVGANSDAALHAAFALTAKK